MRPMSPFGPSRHIALPFSLGHFRGGADIEGWPSIANCDAFDPRPTFELLSRYPPSAAIRLRRIYAERDLVPNWSERVSANLDMALAKLARNVDRPMLHVFKCTPCSRIAAIACLADVGSRLASVAVDQ